MKSRPARARLRRDAVHLGSPVQPERTALRAARLLDRRMRPGRRRRRSLLALLEKAGVTRCAAQLARVVALAVDDVLTLRPALVSASAAPQSQRMFGREVLDRCDPGHPGARPARDRARFSIDLDDGSMARGRERVRLCHRMGRSSQEMDELVRVRLRGEEHVRQRFAVHSRPPGLSLGDQPHRRSPDVRGTPRVAESHAESPSGPTGGGHSVNRWQQGTDPMEPPSRRSMPTVTRMPTTSSGRVLLAERFRTGRSSSVVGGG